MLFPIYLYIQTGEKVLEKLEMQEDACDVRKFDWCRLMRVR
jgi:hypothetical protein